MTMMSSKIVPVVELLRQIDKLNTDLRYLNGCTAIHFADEQEQRRINLPTRAPTGAALTQILQDRIREQKELLIAELAQYEVTYDGE